MILIGMFDSPFVRRVAVSMNLLDLPFEHRNWSVGSDQAAIRQYNPLGRVPTLVLPDGESLVDSGALLDYLDQHVGPERALLPPFGAERRQALQLMALAVGAAEKAVTQIYERVFRPEERRHPPWTERCRGQMQDGLRELNRHCSLRPGQPLVGSRLTQADITVVTAWSFIEMALGLTAADYPELADHAARHEALAAFERTRVPFSPPG